MRLAQPLEPSVRTVSLIAVATASAVSRSDRCRAEANSASHRSFFLFSPVIAILLVGKICPACVGVAGPGLMLGLTPQAGVRHPQGRKKLLAGETWCRRVTLRDLGHYRQP